MNYIDDNTAATTKVIVTKGNLATLTKNGGIRTVTSGKASVSATKGRFTVVDMETGIALDQTNVGSAKKINIGVSIGKEYRWLFGNKGVEPNKLEALSVSNPKCGTNPIYDNFFKCVNCDDTYVMSVQILDEYSRSIMNDVDNGESFTVQHKPNCGGCEPNCNETTNCSAIAPEIVTKLNLAFANTPELKAIATPIYAYDSFWCIPLDADGTITTPFDTIRYNTDVELDISAITTKDQLPTLVDMINESFDNEAVNGTAVLVGVDQYGNSCKPYILINTEVDDFAVTAYVACKTGTPLVGHTGYCGIRIVTTMPSFTCDCKLKTVANFLGRYAKVFGVSGFQDLTTVEYQAMELPANFGAYIKWMEYEQEIGGEGRKYASGNQYVDNGIMMLEEPISRLSNSNQNSDCTTDYVVFQVNFKTDHIMDPGFHNMRDGLSPNGFICVPKGDTTTLTSVQAVLNAIATASGKGNINYAGAIGDQFKGEN